MSMRAFLSKRNRFLEKNPSNLGVGDKPFSMENDLDRPWAVRRIFTLVNSE